MTTITVNTIYPLVHVQRPNRVRTYAPSAASLNRLTRLIAQYHYWIFTPVTAPHIFQWKRVQL